MKIRQMHEYLGNKGVKNWRKMTPEQRVRRYFELIAKEPANKNADKIFYSANVNASGAVAYLLPNRLKEPKKMLKAITDSYARRGSCIFDKGSVPPSFEKAIVGARKTKSGNKFVRIALEHPNTDIGKVSKHAVHKSLGRIVAPDEIAKRRYKGLEAHEWEIPKYLSHEAKTHSERIGSTLTSGNWREKTKAIYTAGENPTLLKEHAEKIVEKLGEADIYVKNAAEVVIQDNPWIAKKYSDRIAGFLDHPEKEVREAAVLSLSSNPNAVELQLSKVNKMLWDKEETVNTAAGQAFGRDPRAVIKFVREDPARIRELSINILGRIAKSLEEMRGNPRYGKDATQALRMLRREAFKVE